MKKPIRFGIVGLTHDHVWPNLKALAALEDGTLAAAADPNQPLLDRVKEQFGCPTYHDHKEMAEREQLDAVFICSDKAAGAEQTVWAAERGLHVMIEKPMAATLDGAERMVAATEKANVRLMINWPIVWRPQVQAALAIATSSEIGDIWQITYRTGHGGPQVECSPHFREWLFDPQRSGAGALVDMCGYGINVVCHLLGRPERITAVAGLLREKNLSVEDNAIVVMSYPRAIATSEGVWGQVGHPLTGYLATIWGTRGSVTFGPCTDGKIWTTSETQDNVAVTPPQPEPHMTGGVAHFLWALNTGSPFHPLCQPEACRTTQEVLEAAKVAIRQGTSVAL